MIYYGQDCSMFSMGPSADTREHWLKTHRLLDPTFETITFGRRGSKELHVSLAEPIWFDRAKLWCQALLVLSYFLTASSN